MVDRSWIHLRHPPSSHPSPPAPSLSQVHRGRQLDPPSQLHIDGRSACYIPDPLALGKDLSRSGTPPSLRCTWLLDLNGSTCLILDPRTYFRHPSLPLSSLSQLHVAVNSLSPKAQARTSGTGSGGSSSGSPGGAGGSGGGQNGGLKAAHVAWATAGDRPEGGRGSGSSSGPVGGGGAAAVSLKPPTVPMKSRRFMSPTAASTAAMSDRPSPTATSVAAMADRPSPTASSVAAMADRPSATATSGSGTAKSDRPSATPPH